VREFRTASEEETIASGERLGREFGPGTVVLLIGNLGAGKTTLAKGLAKGFAEVNPDDVSSPTFTLIHEYGKAKKVFHIDLYRLDEAREAASLGLDEIFESSALILIEWGERFPALMPPEAVRIHIETVGEATRRLLVF
jgi:tRNA threonylcarbamoyladenosine biosynthesis protein TsaE